MSTWCKMVACTLFDSVATINGPCAQPPVAVCVRRAVSGWSVQVRNATESTVASLLSYSPYS